MSLCWGILDTLLEGLLSTQLPHIFKKNFLIFTEIEPIPITLHCGYEDVPQLSKPFYHSNCSNP